MPGVPRTQVLVVGAGPTGLMAALQLAERGIAVEVIEEEWRAAGHSYALALHPRSLALLAELGLADAAIAAGRRVETMTIFDGPAPRLSVPLAPHGGRYAFMLVLPQSALEELLARRLADKGVEVRWSHRLARLEPRGAAMAATVQQLEKESGGYAVAHTEWVVGGETRVESSFVVGADGHRSLVRRALGIAFEETAPSQVFAIAECGSQQPAAAEMLLVVGPGSIDACWPLPDARVRWSLELDAPQVRPQERFKSRLTTQLGERFFHHLDDQAVRSLLRERSPWFDASFDLGWSVEVRFERRLAGSFGRERVWLAGDAAHLTGPAGMQSMNAGLLEAAELADRLTGVCRGQGGLERLEQYGREREAEWRLLLGLDGQLRAGAEAASVVAANARRLLSCLPATGADLVVLAARLGLEVARS